MAELILYYEAILVSLWFSCRNIQLTAFSVVSTKHIRTTTEEEMETTIWGSPH
jgi:hypothetical protein